MFAESGGVNHDSFYIFLIFWRDMSICSFKFCHNTNDNESESQFLWQYSTHLYQASLVIEPKVNSPSPFLWSCLGKKAFSPSRSKSEAQSY